MASIPAFLLVGEKNSLKIQKRHLAVMAIPESVPYEDTDLRNHIQEIALEFPGYGYRRLTAELRNRGYLINHKRVLRLMREDNLLCLKKKFKPVTTDSISSH